jgi:hypothetical protein
MLKSINNQLNNIFMNKRNLALLVALMGLAGVLGTIALVINKDNSADLYSEFRAEFKNSDIKVLDNYTSLSQSIELLQSNKKAWELNKKQNPKMDQPKPTLERLSKSSDEILTSIEAEKKKMLEIKARFDKINCDKVKPEDKPHCDKIKSNFDGVSSRYDNYTSSIKNW